MCGGSAPTPQAPTPAAPLPAVPTETTAEVIEARERQRRRLTQGEGAQSTNVTGPRGDTSQANLGLKQLTGQ